MRPSCSISPRAALRCESAGARLATSSRTCSSHRATSVRWRAPLAMSAVARSVTPAAVNDTSRAGACGSRRSTRTCSCGATAPTHAWARTLAAMFSGSPSRRAALRSCSRTCARTVEIAWSRHTMKWSLQCRPAPPVMSANSCKSLAGRSSFVMAMTNSVEWAPDSAFLTARWKKPTPCKALTAVSVNPDRSTTRSRASACWSTVSVAARSASWATPSPGRSTRTTPSLRATESHVISRALVIGERKPEA